MQVYDLFYRQLFVPGHRARQQKVCHVGAGNQKHAPDRAQQNQQRGANITNQRFEGGNHANAAVRVLIGILLLQATGNSAHFSLGLCLTNIRFETRVRRLEFDREKAKVLSQS